MVNIWILWAEYGGILEMHGMTFSVNHLVGILDEIFKVKFNFIVVTIFLSGCIIQSKQLSGILELIRDPSIDLSMNEWLVRYSDYSRSYMPCQHRMVHYFLIVRAIKFCSMGR